MDAALVRALLRLAVAGTLAVFVPIVAADLSISGVLPTTTIQTAIFFAMGLVAIVTWLALLPVLARSSE